MKKLLLVILFFPLTIYSQVVNEVIASVGDIAITSYDIQRMRDFDSVITGKKTSSEEALHKLITMSSLLIISEQKPEYYMDEAELRRLVKNITNNSTDPAQEQKIELYNKYPDLYRLLLRTDKVKRGLMYGDPFIKQETSAPIPPKEAEDFYRKNKSLFKDSPFPKLDLIIFAVESSPKWKLSELENVENKMQELARDLDASNNFNTLKRKYNSLRFTSYSGATGLFTPDILILQKKIPEEIIGVALQKSINLGVSVINIRKNKGIYIPQPIPFKSTGTPTYLTFKILNIVQPQQLTFEESGPRIEEILRYQRAEKLIDELIRKRISEGMITLMQNTSSYKSVFNQFKKQ
ncbi:MAG: hypothetical protein ACRCTQ_04115 [Brevinemataceae bacterium]